MVTVLEHPPALLSILSILTCSFAFAACSPVHIWYTLNDCSIGRCTSDLAKHDEWRSATLGGGTHEKRL